MGAGMTTDTSATLITDLFEKDHREIDAIFDKIRFADTAAALPLFEEFDRRLERHIDWEERLLFPAAAAKEPWLEQGPIAVMRVEHVSIRRDKADCLAALRRGDGKEAEVSARAMVNVLGQHNMKEEHVLYPTCDECLSPEEKAALKAKLAGL